MTRAFSGPETRPVAVAEQTGRLYQDLLRHVLRQLFAAHCPVKWT